MDNVPGFLTVYDYNYTLHEIVNNCLFFWVYFCVKAYLMSQGYCSCCQYQFCLHLPISREFIDLSPSFIHIPISPFLPFNVYLFNLFAKCFQHQFSVKTLRWTSKYWKGRVMVILKFLEQTNKFYYSRKKNITIKHFSPNIVLLKKWFILQVETLKMNNVSYHQNDKLILEI